MSDELKCRECSARYSRTGLKIKVGTERNLPPGQGCGISPCTRVANRRDVRYLTVMDADLSNQEARVLKLIAWGYSNQSIAVHFSLSTKTVETYKARGFKKLELKSRVDLVRFGIQQGWMTLQNEPKVPSATNSDPTPPVLPGSVAATNHLGQ